jgi:RHS repeat-associated protein
MALRIALRGTAGAQRRGRLTVGRPRALRHARRLVAAGLAPALTATTCLQVVAVVAAGSATATVVSAAVASAPARAASTCSGSVLVFPDSVSGGSSSAEATEAAALGCAVTVFASSDVNGMTQAQMETYFGGFTAIIVGDPSTSTTCSSTVPADALQYAPDWGPAIKGNVALLGTAPVLAGTSGKTLLDDAITYTVAGGSSGTTGLYASLNCDYSTAPAGTTVPLLASVGAGGFAVTGQSANCPDSGTVNELQAASNAAFNGLAAGNLGSWSSPACSVEETLTGFPAGLAGLAFDSAATPATFTASDGATGQAYILAGTLPSAGTLALAPSQGGEVPAGTTAGGANPADSGVSQALTSGSVNTENGDLSQSDADVSVPTFGPPLGFTRSYDADTAQLQEQTGTPGALGYGWTDNWASSLTPGRPVEGDIYTLDGLRSDNGDGGPPASAALDFPQSVVYQGGNMYFADSGENRIQEVAGSTGTQWGIAMTAGDTYTIADTGMTTGEYVGYPGGIAFDSAGDLFFADTGNNRVEEIPATSKTQWGIAMTADHEYTVAGNADGTAGSTGDGGVATSAYLSGPKAIAFDSSGNLYIADSGNNRVQEVAAAAGTSWSKTMTANDIYTVAGSASGTSGNTGNGTVNTSSLLDDPLGITVNTNGIYVSDTGNCKVVLFSAKTGTYWGIAMTEYDEYAMAGKGPSGCGAATDGAAATASELDAPAGIVVSTNIYIADAASNQIQEIASTAHTEFGQSMALHDIYDIAGLPAGTPGYSGDGGAATAAEMNDPSAITLDASGNLYIADANNYRVREVSASTADISTYAGDGLTLATTGDGGPATQAALNNPQQEAFDSHGDTYIADAGNNRIQEIASYDHTQYGIAMTAGDVYTIAGQADGQAGCQCDGHLATQSFLDDPMGLAIDANGDLYVADAGNNRIQEVPNESGTQWGQSMTAGYMYTIAGNQYGTAGDTGDQGPAGYIYIADQWNNRIQEIAAATGTQWGQSMTGGDIYTIAGSQAGSSGHTGDGGAATAAFLDLPIGVELDSAGNLYIADLANNRIQEVAAATHAQWGQQMTGGDMYTIAGSATSANGDSGDGGPATAALLDGPQSIAVDPSGDVYFTDSVNNRVQEIASASGTQWGQSMTAGDIYTVAGSATGTSGNAGDGGPAASALMSDTQSVSVDPEGDLYITDNANDTVREVASAIPAAIPPAPGQTSSLAIAPTGAAPGGLTITQPGGAQVTFWAQNAGACPSQYVTTGSYCILPQDQGATLTYSSGSYTFTPDPGDTSYTYNTAGQLTSETDTAGDTLTITDDSPVPGGTVAGNGTCPATVNSNPTASCQTITSASGRALILGWNGPGDTGQVTSVTDPLNRTWTYGYNTASQLTSATDPLGHETTYTYGPGSSGNPLLASDLLGVTGPDAQAGYSGPDADLGADTVNVYDSQGRVTQQTDPMGWETTFSYCLNTAAGDCMNTATGTGFVTVTDPDGNQTVYDYEQGTLAAQSAWTKTSSSLTLTSENDSVPDTTAASTANPDGGTMQDTSTTNGDDEITTSNYDADGNPITSTSPGANGTSATTTAAYTASLQEASCTSTPDAVSTATCSQDPGPSPVAPGGVITPPSPSSPPPLGLTYVLYDNDGNQLYSTTGVYSPSGSYEYSRTTYQLFKGNSVTLNGTNVTCTYTPPSASLACATINADGVTTQLEYDSAGDLELSSLPDGNGGGQLATTTYTYNGDGEQLTKVAPDGNIAGANAANYTITTVWNSDGEQTSATEGNGTGYTDTPRTSSYTYDGDGNQTAVTDARGYTTTTTYNADDKATLVTNPDGDASLTCYDGDGNIAETVPAVGVATNSLTPANCPTSYPADYNPQTKAPLASDATMETYDAAGSKTAMYSPAPAGQTGYETTTYTYDGNGNLLTTTAPPAAAGGGSQVTVDTYNSAGQLASQTTGYGTSAASTTSYCYDANGDKTSVVYADGNTGVTYADGTVSGLAACETASPWVVTATPQTSYQTTYSYDSAGEEAGTTTPVTAAEPQGATTTWTYDAAGSELTQTDPDGVTATFTQTPEGMAATRTYSGSSAPEVTWAYDASGNLTSMTDATGTSTNTYDSFGELTSAQNSAGATTQYAYNADGLVSSITYPLPSSATWATTDTVAYSYDNADELTGVTDFNSHQIAIANTPDGLPSSETLGASGDTIATTYDATDRPSAITLKKTNSTLESFAYADAPAGNILSETDTPTSSLSPAVYTYDQQKRITSMTPGTGAASNYSFDASGNLTTLPSGATGTYNDADELTSSDSSGTTTNYTYNGDGDQLTATQGSTTTEAATWNGAQQLATFDNSTADMTAAVYNGMGLRASSTITPSGGSASTQQYVWQTLPQASRLIMDSANAYIYATGTAPVEQVNLSTGGTTYLLTDSLGSVRGTVNGSGSLTASTSYSAWGAPETAAGLTGTTPFGYGGGYTDPTGLIYLQNRYYDAAIGQFLSPDPLTEQTLQPYAYAADDPVANSDPAGLCTPASPGHPSTCPQSPPDGGTCTAGQQGCTSNGPNPVYSTPPEAPLSYRNLPEFWTYLYTWYNDYTGPWVENDPTDTGNNVMNWLYGVSDGLCGVKLFCQIEWLRREDFTKHIIFEWNYDLGDTLAPDNLPVRDVEERWAFFWAHVYSVWTGRHFYVASGFYLHYIRTVYRW